jgi:hypothetical protein
VLTRSILAFIATVVLGEGYETERPRHESQALILFMTSPEISSINIRYGRFGTVEQARKRRFPEPTWAHLETHSLTADQTAQARPPGPFRFAYFTLAGESSPCISRERDFDAAGELIAKRSFPCVYQPRPR